MNRAIILLSQKNDNLLFGRRKNIFWHTISVKMEAARLPMIYFDVKISPEKTEFTTTLLNVSIAWHDPIKNINQLFNHHHFCKVTHSLLLLLINYHYLAGALMINDHGIFLEECFQWSVGGGHWVGIVVYTGPHIFAVAQCWSHDSTRFFLMILTTTIVIYYYYYEHMSSHEETILVVSVV